MTVRELLAGLGPPREREYSPSRPCEDYCEREVDELKLRAARSPPPPGPDATSPPAVAVWPARPRQRQPLRRLRAAFGFIEILRIVDHEQDQTRTMAMASRCGTSQRRQRTGRVIAAVPRPTSLSRCDLFGSASNCTG